MPFADELLGASAVEGLTTCLMLTGYDSARTSATVTEFDGMALKNRSDLVYQPGRHELAVQVNGRRMGVAQFDLFAAVAPTVLR